MLNSKAFICVASAILVGSVFATESVTQQLQGNYATITKAFISKDIKPIDKLLAPSFSVVDPTGKNMTRAKVLSDYQMQMQIMKRVTWTRNITSVVAQGTVVVATVDGNVKGLVVDSKGKSHQVQLTATAKDSWTKKGNSWILLKTVVVKRLATMDGKPLQLR